MTSVEYVVTTVPTDDAGARTADAYDWQAAMAAADGLALYLGELDDEGQLQAANDCRILCEYHEDWVVLQAADAELVAAKHKDPSYGAYTTVNKLMTDGGLRHLFGRWQAMGRTPTCRLVTTAGLAPGPSQALEQAVLQLRSARLAGQAWDIEGDYGPAITGFATLLLQDRDSLPQSWGTGGAAGGSTPTEAHRTEVAEFLSMLTIDHGRPHRTYLQHAAPSMFAKPVLERLGIPDHFAAPVWEATVTLFRARMRAAGPRPTGLLPPVMAYRPGTPLPTPDETERELASRIVTLGDIEVAIHLAIQYPRGYMPTVRAPCTTRIGVKMEAGHCTDNSIERAEELRLAYRRYWRERRSGEPTAIAEQQRLSRDLLRICDEVTTVVSTPVAPWGAKLWKAVQERIEALPTAQRPEGMDDDLLLGAICELTSRCSVWFSDRFNIDDEMGRRRALPGSA